MIRGHYPGAQGKGQGDRMERIIVTDPDGVETIFTEDEYGSYQATYNAAVEYAAGMKGLDFKVDGEGWLGQDRIQFDVDAARFAASVTR